VQAFQLHDVHGVTDAPMPKLGGKKNYFKGVNYPSKAFLAPKTLKSAHKCHKIRSSENECSFA
jgi:hypothetical protein